jgi:pimeloyl-ACP methyl ester carboxylesterase
MNLVWRRRSARIDGVLLRWTELGEPTNKAPLVLLHGLNDSGRTWRSIAPHLARDRRVLMPDLPGHGLSARPDAPYTLPWYAQIMSRWFVVAEADSPDVVGHSFGGGLAQMMLLERPPLIRRLVLVSSGGLGREIAVSLRLASVPLMVEHFGQRFMGPGTRLALKAMGSVFSNQEAARLSAMNAKSGSARAFARTVRDVIDWRGQRRSFFARAHELPALPPIAVFWGERDNIIPFAHATALAESVERVQLTRFDGCGHYPHHEQPSAFAEALREFLDSSRVKPARLRTIAKTVKSALADPLANAD